MVKLNSERKAQNTDSFSNHREFIRMSCIVAKCWKIAFHLKADWLVDRKRGSLLVYSLLTFSARGDGFDPRSTRRKISVSKLLYLSVIAGTTLDKCAVLRIGTLNGDPLCRESHPLCRLKSPTVVYMITCRLSSCKTDAYNVRLLIILNRGWSSVYRKTERLNKSYAKRAFTSFFKSYPWCSLYFRASI